jgi:hypothetical protein
VGEWRLRAGPLRGYRRDRARSRIMCIARGDRHFRFVLNLRLAHCPSTLNSASPCVEHVHRLGEEIAARDVDAAGHDAQELSCSFLLG